MNSQELIEIAALAAYQAPAMLRSGCQLARPGVVRYELASRRRQLQWHEELTRLESGAGDQVRLRSVAEEVLTGEILARCWGAILSAHDVTGNDEFTRIAQRVLVGHVEAINHTLALLLDSPHVNLEQAADLNRLRRRAERWTDLLLGPLVVSHSATRFAVDAERAREFAGHRDADQAVARFQQAWPLTHASLKAAFWNQLAPPANPDLNRAIGNSVLSCFSPELFDSSGSLHSLWTVRLMNAADDAQWLVEHLAELESVDRPERIIKRPARFRI